MKFLFLKLDHSIKAVWGQEYVDGKLVRIKGCRERKEYSNCTNLKIVSSGELFFP